MFSGLTNQVSSWMGNVKGEEGDPAAQGVAEPGQSEIAADAGEQSFENVPVGEEGEAAATSPTKGAGVFSSFQSKVSGWVPSMPTVSMPAMPNVSLPNVALPNMPNIPGLKKNSTSADTEGAVEAAENLDNATGGGGDDDEDRSRYISATEGADSRPASGPGTPSDEKGGQVGMVTTKVTQGAKNFGSFLYSAVNKASSKIKETVKDNNILGEFNKEQEEFIKSQQGIQSGMVPWAGHQNEEKVKEEVLGLSSDRRNFVRAPPAGVDFEFNYDLSYPTAVAIMTEDSQLEKMRFDLVPKIITEEQFWRNYFYRVSLICQASDLGTLGAQESENEESLN
ncbi:synapse-associated protein of 47 kDa isoform X4 [Sitodiplosis mosellana]|uniref:synapse-associated protein of 47 kDa isoform X4 n=1 Tax=Sitodiplosis mosellana TaxID=263140 RepID=UPI002444C5E1|nr:synapse-associated protein of 47 kDa isoform X4 [Sitodiplosis mosellana]